MSTPEVTGEVSLRDLSHKETCELLLTRLQRLVHLRHEHNQELNPRGKRFVDKPISETYGQLQKLGLEGEAKNILHPQAPSAPEFLKEEEPQVQPPQVPPDPTLGTEIIRSVSETGS